MIALIFCGDLKYCPYIKRYIERLDLLQLDYVVYYWNRGGFHYSLDDNYIGFELPSILNKSIISKLSDFISFRRWVIKQIKKMKPKKIIVLSSLTGVLLAPLLLTKYRKQYCFDIRDYSYEFILPYYLIEKQLINNSFFTAISSKGFKSFLPEHEYVIAHNFNRKEIISNSHFTKKTKGPINFVWNGLVRYFDYQKQYLVALKNDSRFNIIFHGDGPELDQYMHFCEIEGFNNVIFTGAYDNNLKYKLLEDADILNNCYGYLNNPGNKIRYAVSNRFYDGVVYHIPQLVEPDGYKADLISETNIGTRLKPSESFADELYEYYQSIDPLQFDDACNDLLSNILNEDNNYIANIDEFVLN